MQETKKAPQYHLVAGISFIVLAVLQVLGLSSINTGFSGMPVRFGLGTVFALLNIAVSVLMAIALMMKKRDIMLIGATAGLAVLKIIDFIAGFFGPTYKVYEWNYYSDDTYTFNLFCMLPAVVILAAAVCLFAVTAATLRSNLAAKVGEEKIATLGNYDETIKRFWFAPGAGMGGAVVLAALTWILIEINDSWYSATVFVNLDNIILCVAFIFTALWIVYPEGLPTSEKEVNVGGDGYCGLVKHALLMVFTFGIWLCIWVYRVTKYLNRVKDEEYRNPTKKLLLFIFVPLYSIYWTYKSTLRIDKHAKENNVRDEITLPCLILSVFAPIVSFILMQDKINQIAAVAPAYVEPAAVKKTAAPTASAPTYSAPVVSAPTYRTESTTAETTPAAEKTFFDKDEK